MEKLRLTHTILYSKGWYKRNDEVWKDLIILLEKDGMISYQTEHEVAGYLLNYVSNNYDTFKIAINCLSIAYMFDEVIKRQCWYSCSQDTAIIMTVLSILSQLSRNFFDDTVEPNKNILPLSKDAIRIQKEKKHGKKNS